MSAPPFRYRFADFELDPSAFELRRESQPVKLQRIPMELLILLVAKEGQVASRQEIVDQLWGKDVFVDTEAGINTAIRKIRQVLGDDPEHPRFLQTVTGKGYRFVGAVKETVNTELTTPSSAALPPNALSASPVRAPDTPILPPQRPRRAVLGIVLGLIAAALCAAIFLISPIEQLWRLHQLQKLRVARLTTLPGNVASPSFSPDGSQMAFAWDGENNGQGFDLYVLVIGSSDPPHRLTHHPAPRLSVAWSPDGAKIAISRVAEGSSGVFLVSAAGGPERKISDRSENSWSGSEISWSPDGKQLAMIDRFSSMKAAGSLEVLLLSTDTMGRTEVDSGCESAGIPVFSHNGRYLIWVCYRAIFSSEIEVLRLADHKLGSLYKRESVIEGLAWSRDDKHVVFSTDDDAGALREIEFANPSHEQNLSLGQDALDLATSDARDGVAFVKSSYNVNLWKVDLKSTPPNARALIVSSETNTSPDISPDGAKIAYGSNRGGTAEIWIAEANGSNPQQISFLNNPSTGTPRWSPDSKKIVYDSRQHGEATVYIYDLASGATSKFATDTDDNSEASYSRDGRWLYFCSGSDHGRSALWKAPTDGGHAVMLAQDVEFGLEGVDGTLVYYAYEHRLWSMRPDGTEKRQVNGMPPLNFFADEWTPTATGIFFMEHPSRRTQIEFLDFKTRRVRTIFTTDRHTARWIGAMPVSPDESWMLYPQEDHSSSDLMLMENWR